MTIDRNLTLRVNPRLELERAEALSRSHDDEAAVTAARRVRTIAERLNDRDLLEDVQLAILRFEERAKAWREGVARRHEEHVLNEQRSAA
jgi:hypothetical protein